MRPSGYAPVKQASTLALWALASQLFSASAARADEPLPSALEGVDVVEHLGAQLPLDLVFTDAAGERVKLERYFNHGRPVILALAYYNCPMLCSLVTGGLATALRETRQEPGRDVDLLTVSFDPGDTCAVATAKQTETLNLLNPAFASTAHPEPGRWPFLVGEPEPIRALTDAVGFRYNALPAVKQYAHDAVLFVLTPDGHVSRYLYGVSPTARDLRLALAEAEQGRSGISFERILLSCFRWNPVTRKYHVYIRGFFRAGGALIFLALLGLVLVLVRRERRQKRMTENDLARRRRGQKS